MSYRIAVLLLLIIHSVLSEECFRYVFGEDFEEDFTNNMFPCTDLDAPGTWTRSSYDESLIERPHPKSEWYISPSSTLSCITSFPITMFHDGLVNINVYMVASNEVDFLNINIYQLGGNTPSVGAAALLTSPNNPFTGWQSVNIRINNIHVTEPFQGYITLMGTVASEDAIIMVDSYRYVPPNENEESCVVYEDQVTTTTMTDPTTTTTEPTTTTTDVTTTTTDSITTNADTTTDPVNTTIEPTPPADSCSIWTPLVITLIVLVCVVILAVVAGVAYYIGMTMTKKNVQTDEDDYPSKVPKILPRITKAYPDINANPYSNL